MVLALLAAVLLGLLAAVLLGLGVQALQAMQHSSNSSNSTQGRMRLLGRGRSETAGSDASP
jgi:hypothetical protein